MEQLIILNNKLQRLAALDPTKADNAVLLENYDDGTQNFKFDYNSLDTDAFNLGDDNEQDQEAAAVVIPDPEKPGESEWLCFALRDVKHIKQPDRQMIQVRGEGLYNELADGPVRTYDLTNATPATAIGEALEGTRWELGTVAESLSSETVDLYAADENPLKFLRRIERKFNARLRFHVDDYYTAITDFKVDLLEPEDDFAGLRFEFGSNLEGLDIKVDYDGIKTALYGFAAGTAMDLDFEDQEVKAPEKMDFAGIWYDTDAGDPFDKTLGQRYVGDDEAREAYGIYDPATNEWRHRFGVHESEAETEEDLLLATYQVLQRKKQPRVTVDAAVSDLEKAALVDINTGDLVQLDHMKIRLGNICHVIARHKGIFAAMEMRITEVQRNLKEPQKTQVRLGDPVPLGSDQFLGLADHMETQARQRRRLDRGRGAQTITIASEDTSRNPFYADIVVPAGAENFQDYFEKAMLQLGDGNGKIVILEGDYVYDMEMLVGYWQEEPPPAAAVNVTVAGQGSGTRLIEKDGIDDNCRGMVCMDADNVNIHDLALIGGTPISGYHNGIHFIGGVDAEFRNLHVSGYSHSGILLWNSSKTKAINCVCRDNGGSGINCHTSMNFIEDHGYISELIVTGNQCYGNEQAGIRFDTAENCVCSSNSANGNGKQGISLSGAINCTISGNTCNNSAEGDSSGIGLFFYSARNNVTGNTCQNNGNQGIYFNCEALENNFEGNICRENTRSGIYMHAIEKAGEDLDPAYKPLRNNILGNECNDNDQQGIVIWGDENNVQNNKCYDNDQYGIFVCGQADPAVYATDNLVTNNDLMGNAVGGIKDDGIGTVTTAGNRS